MRLTSTLRSAAVGYRFSNWRRSRARRLSVRCCSLLAAGVAALGLAGCGTEFIETEYSPRLSRARVALLKRQPAPKCEYHAPNDSTKRQPDGSTAAGESDTEAALRTKLDYERQCYKHAEMIARARLTALQAMVEKTAARREYGIHQP